MRKFEAHGTCLNRNNGNSGRRRTGRSERNIEAVRERLAENPKATSARRSGIGLPSATFNRITRLDLTMHPYRMYIRHGLLPEDFDRRMRFARWLINRCQRNEEFLRSLVVGDEAAFSLNGQVNSWNVRHYSRAKEPPEFNFEVNISQQRSQFGWD